MIRHFDPVTEMWRVEPRSRAVRSGPTVLMFGGAAGAGIQFFELAASIYRGGDVLMHFNLLLFGLAMLGAGALVQRFVHTKGLWCGRDGVEKRSILGKPVQKWSWPELGPVELDGDTVSTRGHQADLSTEQPGWGRFLQYAQAAGVAEPSAIPTERSEANDLSLTRRVLGICRPRFELLVALVPTILLFQAVERIFEPGRFEGFEDAGWLSIVVVYLVYLAGESWIISPLKVERRSLFGLLRRSLAWSEVECASITRCPDGDVCGVTLLTRYGSWSFNRTFSTQIDLVEDIYPRIPAGVPIVDSGLKGTTLPANPA
jgi:hypothetical protein